MRRTRCVLSGSLRWWSGAGLNRRPHDFQSRALPAELPDQVCHGAVLRRSVTGMPPAGALPVKSGG